MAGIPTPAGRGSLNEVLLRKVLFPAYETLVRRRGTAGHVAEYAKSQWLSPTELAALQLRKLNALLAHCWTHVPFLQEHWRAAGCRPGALQHVDDLARFPVLTKQLITQHYADMIAVPWRGRTISKTTGGSTGDPFRFEYTMEVYARRTAVMWRGYGWGGAGLGVRAAYLWAIGAKPSLKERLYHRAFNRHYFDAFTMSESSIDAHIDAIARYRPRAIVGYVTPLVLVARRMRESGRRLQGVQGVITGAEALFEPERREIESAFGCPVFNTYGSREVMLMAAECDHHQGLHVNADHLAFETLGPDGAPVHGEAGDVAITDFHNFGMPMVRYLNGDRATYAEQPCGCGRGLPLLSSIDGRILDLIQTPDGRHVPGEYFVVVMLDWPDVKQWQVVQTAPDCVQFRLVVPAPWTDERRQKLTAKVHAKSGPTLRVEIVEVEAIPTTSTGKRRLTISLANAHMVPPLAPTDGTR